MNLTGASTLGEQRAFTVRDVARLPFPRNTPRRIVLTIKLSTGEVEVTLRSTRSGFGGRRYWFSCPECRRRVGTLFTTQPVPLCRYCVNLPFPSSRIRRDRSSHTWQRLAHDLGRVRRLLARRYLRLARRGDLERQAHALEVALCAELAILGDLQLLWATDDKMTKNTFGYLS